MRHDLAPLTGRTVVDPERLHLALTTVVHDGLALEDQEAIVGEAEIAAAVFDHRGYPAGAVGVVGPVERLVPEGKASAALVGRRPRNRPRVVPRHGRRPGGRARLSPPGASIGCPHRIGLRS